jgi:hypothetical protein
MLKPIDWRRVRAQWFHQRLPENIRRHLNARGIPATIVESQLLGWNGERITIPVFGRERRVLGFRYAKAPTDISDTAEVISDPELGVELYGWDSLAKKPGRIVICDGEFDRLVLEAHGHAAVASTGGRDTFLAEWLPYFEPVKEIFICFERTRAGEAAAATVQSLLPRARLVKLPAGMVDVTDFFVWQEQTTLDFEVALAGAAPTLGDASDLPPLLQESRPLLKSFRTRAQRLGKSVKLYDLVEQYTTLRARGRRLVAHCLFHDDGEQSFSVFPQTNTYACSVCGTKGDVVQFLMDMESMSFGQALDALERFEFTQEIYGTG